MSKFAPRSDDKIVQLFGAIEPIAVEITRDENADGQSHF